MEQVNNKILFIANDEHAINYRWEKDANRINQDLKIIPIRELTQLSDEYILPRDASVGSMLALHPFEPNKYININTAEDIIFKDKVRAIGRVAALLGVKAFTAEFVIDSINRRELNIKGDIEYKKVKIGTDYKSKQEELYKNKYKLSEQFAGQMTEADYEKAIEVAKKFGLYEDADISYLIDQRNPANSNHLLKQDISVEITQELNSLKDCAFSLNVLNGLFSLDANLQETISQRRIVQMKTCLEFGNIHH